MVSMRSLWKYLWAFPPRVIGFALCCCAAGFLVWKYRDRFGHKLFRHIIVPSAVVLALVLNPVVAHILVTQSMETRSLRFFWLIPATLLLALVPVRLLAFLPRRRQKLLAALAFPAVLLVLFSDGFAHSRILFQNERPNWYKIPEVVIELDDQIMNDETDLEKTAVFPWPLNMWVRQYRPEIVMPYSWVHVDQGSQPAHRLYNILGYGSFGNSDPVDLKTVDELAVQGGYNYLVLDSDWAYTGALQSYEKVCSVDIDPTQDTTAYDSAYVLYRRVKEGDG